ncbi:hypothetical protein KIPB_013300 [Kipferlia bialata]|uniref:Uncharacterized protein n=1 Tax=Kipferlia bialata TaxID=797122 RepID=A0A9K3DA65_9EUKA|nr:hypothetical protein KIPB_013300 [Kipferlia bialata]|eukprot:g13300.t1
MVETRGERRDGPLLPTTSPQCVDGERERERESDVEVERVREKSSPRPKTPFFTGPGGQYVTIAYCLVLTGILGCRLWVTPFDREMQGTLSRAVMCSIDSVCITCGVLLLWLSIHPFKRGKTVPFRLSFIIVRWVAMGYCSICIWVMVCVDS